MPRLTQALDRLASGTAAFPGFCKIRPVVLQALPRRLPGNGNVARGYAHAVFRREQAQVMVTAQSKFMPVAGCWDDVKVAPEKVGVQLHSLPGRGGQATHRSISSGFYFGLWWAGSPIEALR